MEQDVTPQTNTHETKKHSTPWGVFIGLFLILAIIVVGAYHAFTQRITPQQTIQVK